ncbi:MAG TPA: NUDIX hydrolase [Ktedonobacteraceae bacterium]|nr:NUDIX hydrolase [Ktedonobacteraceae bacterium]
MSETEEGRKHSHRSGPWSMGAGTVVVDQERVLLVRNRFGVTRGRYLLPAGSVHAGELPDRAAERETLEETGLRVEATGLLGVRIWVMESGVHNYFFMFSAKLLSPLSELRPNLAEVDDARFFTRDEMAALSLDETWAGAIAVALKALDGNAHIWPNEPALSSDSGVSTPESWRMWM